MILKHADLDPCATRLQHLIEFPISDTCAVPTIEIDRLKTHDGGYSLQDLLDFANQQRLYLEQDSTFHSHEKIKIAKRLI